MKKQKIILTCLAILAVIAAALAFRASRLPANIYSLLPGNKVASITVGLIVYTTTVPNCILIAKATTNIGGLTNASFTTTNALSTTVFISAGYPNITTTYAYCTPWVTKTTEAD